MHAGGNSHVNIQKKDVNVGHQASLTVFMLRRISTEPSIIGLTTAMATAGNRMVRCQCC